VTAVIVLSSLAAGAAPSGQPPHAAVAEARVSADNCAPVGRWSTSAGDATTTEAIVGRALRAGIVLLGESHDSAEHHRWQLQTLTALHVRQPQMVIALEMFPRRLQPVLDRWVAGGSSEAEFLREAAGSDGGGFDLALYLPIFHFARMNRVPLVAVNVDRSLTREVAEKGFAAVPAERREGIGVPAPALPAYEDMLLDSWREHAPPDQADRPARRDDVQFRRFVESQLVWDRAMAQGISDALESRPGTVVAALMGSGHVEHGWGVAHQLRALGRPAPLMLMPFDRSGDCAELAAGMADAVFGVAAPAAPAPLSPHASPPRPRLGVRLEATEDGVRLSEVTPGSVAERAGLRAGDLLVSVAGRTPMLPIEVAAAVMRQPAGTWLPIVVRRDDQELEFVARFPAEPEP